MECGLVLDVILGHGCQADTMQQQEKNGGPVLPGKIHSSNYDVDYYVNDFNQSLCYFRNEVKDLLSFFHLEDNEEAVNRIVDLFVMLKEKKQCQKLSKIFFSDFRFANSTDKAILGFCVVRVLNELKIPRPLSSIVMVCQLKSSKQILKIADLLSLNIEFDEVGPEGHVDILCAILAIPFICGKLARQLIEDGHLRWKLYGMRPHHIAGAAIFVVSSKMEKTCNNVTLLSAISDVLTCTVQCLKRVIKKYHRFVLLEKSIV